ncbi:GntR family transcriptional regulator [Roseovarius faecimaris]|nr:GntR family transcriptional regulator [Roseovarius faecimaris]
MTPTDIAAQLQSEILSGALPPGAPLSQVELAARFGVSRIPVRDALALLSAEGVITAAPNRTATVLKLSAEQVEEIYHMRMLLEGDLIARAVPEMGAEELAAVDEALKRSSREAGQPGWAAGDDMFHAALYAPARRPRQAAMIEDLRRIARVQIASYGHLATKTPRWVSEHEEIVQACHAKDAREAQRLLRKHLRGARNHLMRAIRQAGG